MKKRITWLILTVFLLNLIPVTTGFANSVLTDEYSFEDLLNTSVSYDLNSDGVSDSISTKRDSVYSSEMSDYCARNEFVINGQTYHISDDRHGMYDRVFITDIDQTDKYLDIILIQTYKGKSAKIYRFDGNKLIALTSSETSDSNYFDVWVNYWDAVRNNRDIDPAVNLTVSDSRSGIIGFTFTCGGEAYSYTKKSDLCYVKADYPIDMSAEFVPSEIRVVLDGEQLSFDQPPVMIDDRVMVPIRSIAENMGDTVKWDGNTGSALIIHPDRMVVFKNNNNSVVIAKEPEFEKWEHYNLDVPPQIIGDRTLTPVRAIAECLGANVDWDGKNRTVYISSSKADNTITADTIKKFNVYYSFTLKDNGFTGFSPEISEFYNNRSSWADAFNIWWDDWFIGIKSALSGEKNNVYMIKNSLAEILSELPESDEIDMSDETKLTEMFTSGGALLSYVDFTKVDKIVSISPYTANALSKFGNALDKAGLKIELTGTTLNTICKMLNDYTNGISYLELIKDSLKSSNIDDEVFNDVLDSLEEEYTNKFISALSDGSKDGIVAIGSFLIGEITGGTFSLASFSKDILNMAAGNDDKADAIKNLHSIYWFNSYIDSLELSIKQEAAENPEKIDDYIRIYNFQKIIKKKLYESMDFLKNSKDQYTTERIREQLNKIENMSYIIWK